jgi:hypothetical protein
LQGGQYLDALTKEQLLRLAEDLEFEGPSAMSKGDLIDAIARQGGVPLGALTKDELVRVGRSAGCDVGTSMTKDELIAAIGPELPVAGQ